MAVFLKAYYKQIIAPPLAGGNSVHLSQKSKVRRHKQKTEQKVLAIESARYVQDFSVLVSFTNGETKLVDFLPLFQKYVKGDNLKYFAPENFKKFIVRNGNIYWDRNEDVVFPAQLLYKQKGQENDAEEEILFVI